MAAASVNSAMAAGRGQFFQSFIEGLERKPDQPGPGRREPGHGWQGGSAGRNRRKRLTKAAPIQRLNRSQRSNAGQKIEPKENFMKRLPFEILTKILSYLDASSLFCISHVSKLFYQLANDDVIWRKIYMSEFGKNQMWRPKSVDDTGQRIERVETEDQRSPGHWKKMYFKTQAGQEVNKWRRELRDISPYTGLPRQTEWVLRNLKVSWELVVRDSLGHEVTLEQSRVYFFESSMIVRWSSSSFPRYHHMSSIRLQGVRKGTRRSHKVNKPDWHSLILRLDMKTQPVHSICKDRLIKLVFLPSGFITGIWRGQRTVAFIMVCLHFHRLVEKSLLGSPLCLYSEPVDSPPVDNSDPEYGLHGYSLHFVLHNTGTEIMSGHFSQLSCRAVHIQGGLVELKVISRTNLSQHRSLSGHIKLPWKSEELEGSVENCCIMTLTLLDVFQKPFWCVSSPVCITMAKKSLSFNYSGRHFLMEYGNADGQVKMMLVWLQEEKQFFLISLTIYISVSKVNKHFSTNY